jgi:aryl-alcohol dehydrogenase-like predicted oxidoreductase
MPETARATVKGAVGKLGFSAGRLIGDGLTARGRTADAAAARDMAAAAGASLISVDARDAETEAVLGRIRPCATEDQPCSRLVVGALNVMIGTRAVEAAARRALQTLRTHSATAIVAAAGDLLGPDGADLWRRLKRLKDEGLYRAIGVRVGAADDVIGLARRFKPDLVQAPLSLLDQRLIATGALTTLAEMGVEAHLRSVLQHGVLFLPRAALPAHLAEAGPRLSRIRRTIAEAGADPLQTALAFALSRPEASSVIVGAACAAEVRAVLAAAAAPPPALDWSALDLGDPAALRAA